ncbi:MAG: aminodeoxychorismate lyase [Patescibacteria group bacterium]|nr:MAG: aminodeoxychorismate lyase [Patescibacteria group bacterium]
MKKLIIILLLIVVLSIFGYGVYNYLVSPVDPNAQITKSFVIKKGESLADIAKRLEAEGLIKNRLAFILVVKQLAIENKIQAGSFNLTASASAFDIAKSLTKGTNDVWVTVQEGLRAEEIADIYAKTLNIDRNEFLRLAEGKEGYLFPDTYLVPKLSTANLLINLMTKTFDKKVTQEIRSDIEKQGLSFYEGLILASLVEREARSFDEKVVVASILLKRLKNDWPLQVDATVQYVLGYSDDEKTYWKKNLTKKDLEVDSPYNTYKYKGLPPAPICNPGLDSIKSVALADVNTPYWYYLADKTGKTHFSKTLQEHNEKINKYLR